MRRAILILLLLPLSLPGCSLPGCRARPDRPDREPVEKEVRLRDIIHLGADPTEVRARRSAGHEDMTGGAPLSRPEH